MVKFIKSGLYTSLQDIGRKKYRNWGIPESGFMDANSAKIANLLLANPENKSLFEVTMMGPIIEFQIETYIAITGAEFEIYLNEYPFPMYQAVLVKKGDILKFGKLKKGLRAYLAIQHSIETPIILESQSFYHPITENSTIKNGDIIKLSTIQHKFYPNPNISYQLTELDSNQIEVKKGPEFSFLNPIHLEKLDSTNFEVTNRNNRMAYALSPNLPSLKKNLITCPVLPGTIQLTKDGSLFVLMRDGQTTGGYPRILQLTETSIHQLSQLKIGSNFKFKII